MTQYPPPSDLAAWVAPCYMDAVQAGTLRASYFRDHPFPHCVLPDFLQPDVFERLRQDCLRQETTEFKHVGDPIYQGFVRVPDVLRLLYGAPLRRFLNALTGMTLTRPTGDVEATALAQVRHYTPGGTGLIIHNDAEVGFDVSMLFYLTDRWRPGLGGETCLYRQVGSLMLEEKVILPYGNTLVLFVLSDQSFHRVQDMNGDWRRSNLFLGWQASPAGADALVAEDGVTASHVTRSRLEVDL